MPLDLIIASFFTKEEFSTRSSLTSLFSQIVRKTRFLSKKYGTLCGKVFNQFMYLSCSPELSQSVLKEKSKTTLGLKDDPGLFFIHHMM